VSLLTSRPEVRDAPKIRGSQMPGAVSRRTFTRRQKIVVTIANLALFCLLWEALTRVFDMPSLLVPRFSAVAAELPEMIEDGVLWTNAAVSLKMYFIGMAISIVLAIPMGLVIGGVKWIDRILSPYVWALYTLPRLILMPFVLLWVGINDAARVTLIVLSAVPAILVVVMEGVKTTDASLLRAARSFGARRLDAVRAVVLPSMVPHIATGVRMGVSRGLLGLFIGELFTASTGIGFVMVTASRQFDSARVYLILFLFIGFSVALVGLTQWLESRASRWRTG
jgi:ABC-type nitrate/sulfonate/bicarbonate transport system permease component